MTLLHPWAIGLGLAAVGLPVAIHFLTRPRPRRLPLSTLRFVREAVQQRRARSRLRDWIILLLRTAAVALLGFAFARPLIGAKPLVVPDKSSKAVRIVIVDQSQSMGARVHGVAAFEKARATAAKYLEYDPQLRANLILAGAQPRGSFDRLTTNFAALRDELGKSQVRSERLNLQAAINQAGEMLSGAPGDELKRELVIISDFQRSNWTGVDFSPLPKATLIQMESVAPSQPVANLAILRVASQGRMEQGRDVRLEVEVGNYSPVPQSVQVEVTLGDSSYRLTGLCPPNVKTTLSGDVALRDSGFLVGQAKLIGMEDGLAADDVRPFVLNVHHALTYALITRESSKPQPSSSHFLERALVPIATRNTRDVRDTRDTRDAKDSRGGERVVRLEPGQVERDALANVDLIVLDHPGKLSASAINLLASLMRRGRGVLYVAAEPIDATNLKLLADAAGTDLRLPVEFLPPEAGKSRRELFLAEMRREEAPFLEFGENLNAAVGPLRFGGGLSSRRLETGLVDDVLASYSDRSAALVLSGCAAGSLAVLNTDLNQSNLRSSAVFVPLMGELVGRMLGQRRTADAVACGEPVVAELPAEAGAAAGLKITGPESAGEDLGSLVEENNFVSWRWNSAAAPGVYQIKRDATMVYALASAVPAVESDLMPIDPQTLKDRIAGGRNVAFHSAGDDEQRRDNTWAWLAVACLGCMLAELVALKAFKT